MTPAGSAPCGDDLQKRIESFVRKVFPFAYCDACLALRCSASLQEVTAVLPDLANVLTRARRTCYGCGRLLELSALRDGSSPR